MLQMKNKSSRLQSRHRAFGKIDILVNNAGITRDQLVMPHEARGLGCGHSDEPYVGLSVSQQVTSFDAQTALGRIINIASVFGQIGAGGAGQLRRVEAGLLGLTMAIARETGVRTLPATRLLRGSSIPL